MSLRSRSNSRSSATALDAYFENLERSTPLSQDKEVEYALSIDQARLSLWCAISAYRPLHAALVRALSTKLELQADVLARVESQLKRAAKAAGRNAPEQPIAAIDEALALELVAADKDDELLGAITRDIALLLGGDKDTSALRPRRRPRANRPFEAYASQVASGRARLHRYKSRLAQANLRLVVKMAKRYAYSAIPLMDLVQEGNIGLLKAVDRFDVSKGFRFSTYATWWVRHALTRCVYNDAGTVRVPVHVQERQRQIAQARRELEAQSGSAADVNEVAQVVGISVEKVRAAEGVRSYRTLSFHAPVHPGSLTPMEEIISDPDAGDSFDEVCNEQLREAMEPAFGELDAVEYDILRRRFGLDGEQHQTLRAVGAVHGLSRERIRQIQTRALEKMRHCIETQGSAVSA